MSDSRHSTPASPLIGVTGPSGWYHLAWRFSFYALGRAGARCVRLTPAHAGPLSALDGVVIGGGDDIDPALYAGLDDGKGSYDRERDAFELRVLEDAVTRNTPILGICRGAQLLNSMLGGNLHQNVRDMRVHTSNRRTVLPRKTVSIQSPSRLSRIMSTTTAQVNSLHHQAVNRPGEGLRIVARDRDNIVQAVEACDDAYFRLGVQWHPEYLPYRNEQRNLFRALVKAARRSEDD